MSNREPIDGDRRAPSLRRRLGWFVLLYLGGLIAAGAAMYLLRFVLGIVFQTE